MTQIITITNQKGGVGKTTTAAALISGLNQRGARVLGIDLDPQGNLGFSLGLEIGSGYTTYDLLSRTQSVFECISSTKYGDIIPSDVLLSSAEVEFTSPRREFMLADQIYPALNHYDFIIIDTPPALNILTINAYVASTGLIIPMEPEILSLVGVSQLRDTYETVQKSCNPHLKVLGILMNQYNHRLILHRDVLEMAEEVAQQMGSQVFPAKIRRSVDVAAAPAHGQSVLTYSPKSNPARDFRKVIDCIVGDAYPRPRIR
ncbi:MAG: ParA family protein [Oscillospiraceae bacterium]|nr:ParA family protein [Oscillospiraceae bacterium]MBR6677626.1 ParA family protein [Oscillospiraceae bacterium]